jgi:hypothetical protein
MSDVVVSEIVPSNNSNKHKFNYKTYCYMKRHSTIDSLLNLNYFRISVESCLFVLMVVVLWVVTQSNLLGGHWYFRGTHQHQHWSVGDYVLYYSASQHTRPQPIFSSLWDPQSLHTGDIQAIYRNCRRVKFRIYNIQNYKLFHNERQITLMVKCVLTLLFEVLPATSEKICYVPAKQFSVSWYVVQSPKLN